MAEKAPAQQPGHRQTNHLAQSRQRGCHSDQSAQLHSPEETDGGEAPVPRGMLAKLTQVWPVCYLN